MKTVIEMAIEAGLIDFRDPLSAEYTKAVVEDLTAFAELVRADEREQGQKWFDAVTAQHKQAILAEREACAKVVEINCHDDMTRAEEAAAIRARRIHDSD